MLLRPGEASSQEGSGTPQSVAPVRRWVGAMLPTVPPVVREDIELAVSELASNSVRHAQGPYQVGVRLLAETTAYVEVIDGGAGSTPQVQTADDDAEGGRGLAVVESVAAMWDTSITKEGRRRVWAVFTWELAPLPRRSERTQRPMMRGQAEGPQMAEVGRDVVAYAA